uniref:Envelope fusion glycoprotein n=1 Tax=Adineta vaga TaxID=104782 RepID=A0A1W6BQZ8_ADIVA|nr:envelope fusion glycoprotein [Adineta vaga]
MSKFFVLLIIIPIGSSLIPLPPGNVVHPTSGLAFRYLGQYAPADNIISFTVAIPLTQDMCYLLPLHTLHKIPQCGYDPNGSSSNDTTRHKRLVSELIAIGIGSAALTMSTINYAHVAQIQHDLETITRALTKLDSVAVELLHLQAGQLKLALALNHTQNALNRTINIINHHGIAIEHLGIFAKYLDNRLSTFIHSVESHFLHTSIADILANRLNLNFIHHRDLNKVAKHIALSTNVNFTTENLGPPLIELISRLLVQQTIHFLPKTSSNQTEGILGTLSISSFFADVKRRVTPFAVYELFSVPFYYYGKRIRLANLPKAIGIDYINFQLIQWTKSDFQTCNFNDMSVCRETPPIITKWNNTCLFQILNDSILSACRTEPYNEDIFYQQIGSQWIISTTRMQRCNFATAPTANTPQLIQNTGRTLSTVTLITIPSKTTLLCEQFHIPASPETSAPPVSLWDFSLVNFTYGEKFDMHDYLHNHTRWPKIPFISNELQEVIKFISQQSSPPSIVHVPSMPTLRDLHRHPIGILNITTLIIITLLFTILAVCFFIRRPRLPSVYFRVPTSTNVPTTT